MIAHFDMAENLYLLISKVNKKGNFFNLNSKYKPFYINLVHNKQTEKSC